MAIFSRADPPSPGQTQLHRHPSFFLAATFGSVWKNCPSRDLREQAQNKSTSLNCAPCSLCGVCAAAGEPQGGSPCVSNPPAQLRGLEAAPAAPMSSHEMALQSRNRRPSLGDVSWRPALSGAFSSPAVGGPLTNTFKAWPPRDMGPTLPSKWKCPNICVSRNWGSSGVPCSSRTLLAKRGGPYSLGVSPCKRH